MKRFLALFLCFALCLTLIPAASAEDIELVDEPAGADAPGGPTDEIVIDPVGADAPGGPLDDIALADEPEAAPPFDDVEGDLDNIFGTLDNGLKWSIINFTLMIDGSGEIPDFLACEAPWYEYLERIHTLEVGPNISRIGNCAFYGLTNLENLRKGLPWYLESIGDYAFFSCSSLKDIMIDAEVTSVGTQAFNYCSSLRRLSFCGAPSVGSLAFGNCGSIGMLSFVGGVPSFSSNSFSGTSAAAWYPPDNSSWTASARQNYGGSITWQTGYRGWAGDDIEWTVEGNHLSLTGTGWTDAHNRVGYRHLNDRITSASVGEGITGLSWTFDRLTSLRTVSLPDSLLYISDCAFQGCTALESLTIPASVESLGLYTFIGDTSLRVIRFRGRMPELKGSGATSPRFEGVTATVYYPPIPGWSSSALQDQGGTLTLVCDDKVGDNVTWSLNDSGLLTLTGSGATWNYPSEYPGFYYVRDEIFSAVVGDGVTGLGSWLFYDLNSLEEIRLGSGLTAIGNSCFQRCSSLEELVFTGNAPSFGSNVFAGVTATAWFPAGNSTWTSSVMQDYGGTITWMCNGQVGDDVWWSLSGDGTLTLSGTGPTWDYVSGYPGFYGNKSEIKNLVVEDGVTTLGKYLFDYLAALETADLGKDVELVDRFCFRNCSSLYRIRFRGHAPSFGSSAFQGVDAAALYYPVYSWTSEGKQDYGGTITWAVDNRIGDGVTWSLSSYGSLDIAGSGETWGYPREYPGFYSFREECKSLFIYNGVTGLGSYLFYGMVMIGNVTLPASLTTIGSCAFAQCSALNMKFPGDAPEFGNQVFRSTDLVLASYPANGTGWDSVTASAQGASDVVWAANYAGSKIWTYLDYYDFNADSIGFTVENDDGNKALLIAARLGDEYMVRECTMDGGYHTFTLALRGGVNRLVIVLKGDVNLDGAIKASEATMIKRAVAGTYNFKDALAALVADVNGDGTVKASDATMLARSIAGTYTIKW